MFGIVWRVMKPSNLQPPPSLQPPCKDDRPFTTMCNTRRRLCTHSCSVLRQDRREGLRGFERAVQPCRHGMLLRHGLLAHRHAQHLVRPPASARCAVPAASAMCRAVHSLLFVVHALPFVAHALPFVDHSLVAHALPFVAHSLAVRCSFTDFRYIHCLSLAVRSRSFPVAEHSRFRCRRTSDRCPACILSVPHAPQRLSPPRRSCPCCPVHIRPCCTLFSCACPSPCANSRRPARRQSVILGYNTVVPYRYARRSPQL